MNCLLRISLLFSFLSAHFYSLGVTTSENYVTNGYYLGSIATITDKNGSILQTNRYLSGGLPQTAMTVNDRFIDNHLYCSMQYTGTHSMGFYDNTARIYDAILTRFTTQDPLSEKYPDISPYASRANNPMMFVDENGEDIFVVDNVSGGILKRLEDNTQDLFIVTTEYEWNKSPDISKLFDCSTLKLKYGTIEQVRTISCGENKTYDIYNVRGDDNARSLYHFLSTNVASENNPIEFGLTMTGEKGDKGLNFITSGHEQYAEPGLTNLYKGQTKYGYNIREMSHSHQKETTASKDDIDFKSGITKHRKLNGLFLPKFTIFLNNKKGGIYIYY